MNLPRVMADIVGSLVLGNEDRRFLKDKYLRRGRYVEHAVTLLAQGQQIKPEWYEGTSGKAPTIDDPRDDELVHETCREYIEGGAKFLRENSWTLEAAQVEVVNPVCRYQGHIDWLGGLTDHETPFIIDLKNGKPPAADSPLDIAYRYQLAGYALAYLAQYNIRCRRADLFLFEGDYRFVERTDRQDLTDFHTLVQFYHLSRRWHREAD